MSRPSNVQLRARLTLRKAAIEIARSRLADVQKYARLDERNPNPNAVKDLRVALRRMRTAIEFFTDVPDAVRESTRALGGALGAVRDGEVQLAWLDSVVERRLVGDRALTGMRRLRSEIEAVVGRQRQEASALVSVWLEGDAKTIEMLAFPIRGKGRLNGSWALRRLESRMKELRRLAKHLREHFDIGHGHEFRTQLRRTRYQAELLEPVFRKVARGIVKRAIPLQDAIGQWCDVDHRKGLVEKFAVRVRTEDEPAVIELLQLLDVEQNRAEQRARSALSDWLAGRHKRALLRLVAA